ncbi:uncharacterized protein LOC119685354 [Teleopsis dalmanni]|uniref:uncharacterized protein LOC119685354 n=1 Tax=Teleopsis dalmanni TaxID=139649 RepID=UPI000D32B9EA|nr:uncharacterized protein LOC119685354 [Teleopsis dalmanni]
MRERSQSKPRRRGPKLPLPARDIYDEHFEAMESPYYMIDNTEDIYGTTLSPTQRCYVDPWDLENYDYVRKKVNTTPSNNGGYYDAPISPSPAGEPVETGYYYKSRTDLQDNITSTRMSSSTMPRNRRRSHYQCDLDCCAPSLHRRYNDPYGFYETNDDKYADYMQHMTANLLEEEDFEQTIYNGYGGISSSSSTEPHSSIGDESVSTLMLHTPGFGAVSRKRGLVLPKPAPKLEFPAPPPLPPTYDYCSPYATMPYCIASECYECISQAQRSSLIYASPSTYGSTSIYNTTLGRRPSSSLYGGIYSSKFGLSKKGLLQIDYSCSWNDLDRVISHNY